MKKFIGILVVLALIFSLVACKTSKTPTNNIQNNVGQVQESNNAENVLDENNTVSDGENVSHENVIPDNASTENIVYIAPERLNVYGIQQSIELPEMKDGEQKWKYTISNSSILNVQSDEFISTELEDGSVSDVGTRVVIFEGLSEGETEIVFENENEDILHKRINFVLKVNAEKNVAIVSETIVE